MRPLAFLFLAALAFSPGCSTPDQLTPSNFTREFADAFKQAAPQWEVEITGDFELNVTSPSGATRPVQLDNLYDAWKQQPAARAKLIQKHVLFVLEAASQAEDAVDRARIVPVIKNRAWLEETRKALLTRGPKGVLEYIADDFNVDLVVVYAVDRPTDIRYLSPADLGPAKIARADLRALACENLNRLLPKIERAETDGLYVISAGGSYEASLLLLDSFWTRGDMTVRGEMVVAIPTRGVLLVAGSEDAQALEKMKQVVAGASAQGPYTLTSKLLVRRNNRFVEFSEGAGPDK